MLSGVALVTTSTPGWNEVQVVMATGQETMSAARPTCAGLKILKPSPPIDCLATTMAKIAPIATI